MRSTKVRGVIKESKKKRGVITLWPRSTTSSSREASEQKSPWSSPPFELRLEVLLYNWLAKAFDPAPIPRLPGL